MQMNRNFLNKKGLTLLELMFAISLSSLFIIVLFDTPASLLKSASEYETVRNDAYDYTLLRKSIAKDGVDQKVVVKNTTSIVIGSALYEFDDNRVSRDGVYITYSPYTFTFNEITKELKLKGEKEEFTYKFGSSFKESDSNAK